MTFCRDPTWLLALAVGRSGRRGELGDARADIYSNGLEVIEPVSCTCRKEEEEKDEEES